VVRELASAHDFKDDFKKAGSSLCFRLFPLQMRKNPSSCCSALNFIAKKADNTYEKTALSLTTGRR